MFQLCYRHLFSYCIYFRSSSIKTQVQTWASDNFVMVYVEVGLFFKIVSLLAVIFIRRVPRGQSKMEPCWAWEKYKITDDLCLKFHCASNQSRHSGLAILGKYLIFVISEYFLVMELVSVLARIPCPY